jgi:hypothetical protein
MKNLVAILICTIPFSGFAQQPAGTARVKYNSVTVHGSILRRDAEGTSPVIGVNVKLVSRSNETRETFSQSGEFYLYKVSPGDYDLIVQLRDSKYTYGVTVGSETPNTEIPAITLEEWVYYGNRNSPDKPGWEELLFHRKTGDDQEPPQVGDIIVANKDVSIRQGPDFSNESGDLFFDALTGRTIGKGEVLKVTAVRGAFPGDPPNKNDASVWIRFVRVR